MTAIIPEATAKAVTDGSPVLAIAVTEATVLAAARHLHDRKCRSREACTWRDGHALQGFGDQVNRTLEALLTAQTNREI